MVDIHQLFQKWHSLPCHWFIQYISQLLTYLFLGMVSHVLWPLEDHGISFYFTMRGGSYLGDKLIIYSGTDHYYFERLIHFWDLPSIVWLPIGSNSSSLTEKCWTWYPVNLETRFKSRVQSKKHLLTKWEHQLSVTFQHFCATKAPKRLANRISPFTSDSEVWIHLQCWLQISGFLAIKKKTKRVSWPFFC